MEVHIDDVATDSVLSDNLMNAAGSMILGRGTKLTEAILNRLRKMGVETLAVDSSDAEQLLVERKELLAELELRFSGTEGNVYLQELKRVAIEHISI
jgi:hypothetical protein